MSSQAADSGVGLLHRKVAVITGAGSGMAKASTMAFVREGARVLAADISGAEKDTANEAGDAVVRVTTTAWPAASSSVREAMWMPMPPMSPSRISISPVWMAARMSRPRSASASLSPNAQRSARVGVSKVARMPSPVVLTNSPCHRPTSARATSSW